MRSLENFDFKLIFPLTIVEGFSKAMMISKEPGSSSPAAKGDTSATKIQRRINIIDLRPGYRHRFHFHPNGIEKYGLATCRPQRLLIPAILPSVGADRASLRHRYRPPGQEYPHPMYFAQRRNTRGAKTDFLPFENSRAGLQAQRCAPSPILQGNLYVRARDPDRIPNGSQPIPRLMSF